MGFSFQHCGSSEATFWQDFPPWREPGIFKGLLSPSGCPSPGVVGGVGRQNELRLTQVLASEALRSQAAKRGQLGP